MILGYVGDGDEEGSSKRENGFFVLNFEWNLFSSFCSLHNYCFERFHSDNPHTHSLVDYRFTLKSMCFVIENKTWSVVTFISVCQCDLINCHLRIYQFSIKFSLPIAHRNVVCRRISPRWNRSQFALRLYSQVSWVISEHSIQNLKIVQFWFLIFSCAITQQRQWTWNRRHRRLLQV